MFLFSGYNFFYLLIAHNVAPFFKLDAQLRLYMNGIQVAISGPLTSQSVSTTLYSKLAFGVDEELFTLNGKHYGLHIDDIAYWSMVLSVAEIRHVMKGGMPVFNNHFHWCFQSISV